MPLAEVIPLGPVVPVACAVVAANLQTVLDLPTRVAQGRALPPEAHLPARGQYNAAPLLKVLSQDLPPGEHLLRVGVTAADLCLPVLTYVYGEAWVGGRLAVVSTHRLGGRDPAEQGGRSQRFERLAKVALHEAAHAIGLTHCREPGCLMVFSVGLDILDQLRLRFCPRCEHALAAWRRAFQPV